MKQMAQRLVAHKAFDVSIIVLILINAVILGLETSEALVADFGQWLEWGHDIILALFIAEAILKITAVAPRWRAYFGDGWNLFDFSIIVLSVIPATGQLAMIARLARLLRVLRLISTIPELRLIVETLVRSIPSMGHVLMLMSIIFYIYAVAGYHMFHEHDPTHWRNLGISLLTLFRVVTLEDWTDVMYAAMEWHPLAWIYFVSFVICGTFVIINLFIAVVLNNLEEAKLERLQVLETVPSKQDIMRELQQTRQALIRLEQNIERTSNIGSSTGHSN